MPSPSPVGLVSALAQNVSQQFASRPIFEQVAQHMLEQAIKEIYPALTVDLSKTRLATPNVASRGWHLQPFLHRVFDYLALGTPVDFRVADRHPCFLSEKMPHPLRSAGKDLDMKVIEKRLLELPWSVPIGFEDALTRYWNADIGTDTPPSISRWRWLSEVFKNLLHMRGLQQPGLTDQAREALNQIVQWPAREQRLQHNSQAPVHAYSLTYSLTQGPTRRVLPGHEILLIQRSKNTSIFLLCGPGSAVQSFESLEACDRHRGEQIASRYVVDSVTCQRNEISGDAFDTQAAMLLEQQLADLTAVQLPSRIGLQDLHALYTELSDPARFLLDAPRPTPEMSARLTPLLPEWLKAASVVDQTKFQRYSLALASAKKRRQGRTFLSDIQDIKTFTQDALLKHMQQTNDSSPTKLPASHYLPNDVELSFIVAAGYPGTTGIIEKKTMSLTELAINNLVARPGGHVTLSHRLGLTLPAWLTPDFITRTGGLIEQVDIGTTYPRYLQHKLFDDLPHAQERQQLFAEQVPAHLLLEALKQVLNHEHGMTRQGLGLVEALLEPDADDQQVDDRPVVIRHLALLRKPEARPDPVTNMFIIEPQDVDSGPHLLYRPLYTPALQQFATRQALLEAIVKPGELQNSVLTWLPDAARPVYANGGFHEPHIVRFLSGDEFSLPDIPAPATLAINGVNDELLQFLHNSKLMQYLYGSTARALVAQADRDSVSNSESRWAVLIEGGSLLFGTLMLAPFLPGPIVAATWLWSLIASATHDIPALASENPLTRELATVDLLLNLSMLAIPLLTNATVHAPLPKTLKQQAMLPPAPRVIPEQWPLPKTPDILEGPVALPGEHPDATGMSLDFSFASARQRLTPEQRARLLRLQVPRPASLPQPLENGMFKGLYVIGNKWHALVEDHLYAVSPQSDGSATIIDSRDPARSTPVLQSDQHGNWSVDLRLRLRGGMPPKRVEELRLRKAQRRVELLDAMFKLNAQKTANEKALNIARHLLGQSEKEKRGDFTDMQRTRIREKFYELLQTHTDTVVKVLDTLPEHAELGIKTVPEIISSMMEWLVERADEAIHLLIIEQNILLERSRALVELGEAVIDTKEKVCDIYDRVTYWHELRDRYLEQLLNLDAATFERLTEDWPWHKYNALTTKASQLNVLWYLSIKDIDFGLDDNLRSIIEPLTEQLRSHSDLRRYDLSPAEQLEVLASLSEQYGNSLDALQGMKTLYVDEIDEAYFDRLLRLVEGLYQDVLQKLAAEVKPEPQPRKRPPRQPKTAAGRPQKKVIKTRKNGVLIGDLKPASENFPLEVVELRSETDDTLLARYSRHGDVWDIVEEVRPAPPSRTRPLDVVKGDVRKLLGQLEKHLGNAESYKKRCRFPQEIEEILNNEANRFGKLSEEFERALTASQTPRTQADQTLIEQMSEAISRLKTKGSALRTELSLQLPPTDGNLQYLFDKKLIQVARLGERIALKGVRKDFLEEYAINDRDGRPLWYAHFHYATANTPKADYSVAHLKTKEQRKEHYYSQLAKADNPYAVVDVHRGLLGKALAQRWFLPLAP
ncbi:dermonecrotic toxin domain-containing protein [Pseudomonas mucidolens]|uniref:dermonecrotic toxin domain-containing protein n=1 Tax=Pseudomonas mucidolens TaxID=46679 RepID=UPI0030D954B8